MTADTHGMTMIVARWLIGTFASLHKDARDGIIALLGEYDDADYADNEELVETIVELFLDEPVKHESIEAARLAGPC